LIADKVSALAAVQVDSPQQRRKERE